MKTRRNVLRVLTIIISAVPLVGVAQSDDEETTYDGLVEVRRAGFANVWIKPDVDISRYNKILPGPAQFHYRDVPEVSTLRARSTTVSEFPIPENDKVLLEQLMEEAFEEELMESRNFELTDEPGPDTLFIWGGLHDIVSNVPPDLRGPGEIYLSRVGVATLVLQIEDSTSREVLARVVERRNARTNDDISFALPANRATNTTAVRRMARSWARTLRTGLDRWHDLSGEE